MKEWQQEEHREQKMYAGRSFTGLSEWRQDFLFWYSLRKGETMGVNLIFKIAAVGILVSVMCQVLKHSGREDQAFLTSLAGLILVLFWIVPYIYDLFETIKNLFSL